MLGARCWILDDLDGWVVMGTGLIQNARPNPLDQGREPILQVNGLGKAFGGVQAVLDVGFTLFRGEILGIIGPNGAGKTTLINLITGFVRPDTGTVVFNGKNIRGLQPHKIANLGLARTFQVMRTYHKFS